MMGFDDPNSGDARTVVSVFEMVVVVVVSTCFALTALFPVPQKLLPPLRCTRYKMFGP